jgi:lipopolysaccharide transport system permease protein
VDEGQQAHNPALHDEPCPFRAGREEIPGGLKPDPAEENDWNSMTPLEPNDTKLAHVGSGGTEGAFSIIKRLWQQRKLVREMTRRELTDLHAGQAAGYTWLLVHPLLQFVIYAFLFTVVFQVRIAGKGPADYLVYIFAGLPAWLMMQDVISRSSNIIIANQAIIKKVMFPIEVIVAKAFFASVLVQSLLFFSAILFILYARGQILPIHAVLPVVIVMQLALTWGIALFLSAITPFFRDTSEIVRVFVAVNIYLIPILYLPDATPALFKTAITFNPFSHIIWCYQDVLYFNEFRHPYSWLIAFSLSLLMLFGGSYVFSRLRHYFSSVL